MYRYYFKESLTKFYTGLNFSFLKNHREPGINFNLAQKDKTDCNVYGYYARLGYQFCFNFGLVIDLNIGGGYRDYNYTKLDLAQPENKVSLNKDGFTYIGDLSFGYRF